MSIIKFANQRAETGRGLREIIEYVIDNNATKGRKALTHGTIGNYMTESMQIVKDLYRKTTGRQYIHIIVSLEETYGKPCDRMEQIVSETIDHFFSEFQYIISTHQNTKHLHNHVIINSVNAENGTKFQMSAKKLEEFKEYLRDLFKEYGIEEDIEIYETEEDSIEIEEDDVPIYIDEILDDEMEEEEELDDDEVIQLVERNEESSKRIQLVTRSSESHERTQLVEFMSKPLDDKMEEEEEPDDNEVIQLVEQSEESSKRTQLVKFMSKPLDDEMEEEEEPDDDEIIQSMEQSEESPKRTQLVEFMSEPYERTPLVESILESQERIQLVTYNTDKEG